jgi:hypothetical protein
MAKAKKGDAARQGGKETAGHGARAHGIAPRLPTDLPATRDELIALHALERRRRAEAPLGSDEYQAAAQRLAEIEIHIARIERELEPPRV